MMIRKRIKPLIRFIFSYSLALLLSHSLYCAFENTSSGARPYGMGEAFAAMADDVQAIFYNPAGLAQIRHKELVTYYGRPFLGLSDKSNISDSFIGYLHPIRGRETLAVSLSDLRLSSAYSENIFSFSYAKDIIKGGYVGFNLKALRLKYGNDSYTEIDPVFKKFTQTSFSGDIGVFAKVQRRITVGAAVFNINEPNVGIDDVVRLPIKMRLGIGYHPVFASLALDVEKTGKDLKYFFGTEKSFFLDKFFVREGIGYGKDFMDVSLGLSYLPDPLRIDYAFQLPLNGIEGILGSHRISIIFEFGKELHDPYVKDLEDEISKLSDEKEKLQKELKSTKEELSGISIDMKKTEEELGEIKKRKEQLEEEKRRRPKPKKMTYHTVQKGDTLSSISRKYYGTPDKWQTIYNANKSKIERGVPVEGERLLIP